MPDRLLLADGTSFLLLANATDKLLLSTSANAKSVRRVPKGHQPVLKPFPGRSTTHRHRRVHRPAVAVTPTTPTYYPFVSTAAGAVTPRWRVRVVGLATANYTGHGEFPSAVPTLGPFRLNAMNETRVTVSIDDPSWSNMEFTGQRLVEVWLDGDLKFRGWPVRGPIDKGARTCTFQLFDETWPLWRRVFGRADRTNLLHNGGFEESASSYSPWTLDGSGTVTIDTTTVNDGSRSLKMVSAGGAYLYQSRYVQHTYPPGLVVRFAVYFHIPTGDVSPNGNLAGVIKVTDPTLPSNPYFYGFVIDDDAPRGGWERRYVDALLSKANTNYLVEVRLYGTTGTIYWDSAQLVFNEATTLEFPGEDQAVMFRKIVEYAQDTNQGKSPLGLATNCPATGVRVLPAYVHADHRGIYQALQELAGTPNGPDFDVVLTPGTTTFTTYHPSKGSTHAEWTLEEGRNLGAVVYEPDGSELATSVIVLGETPDFDREESGAVDTSQTGGLILERVVRAQPNTPVSLLTPTAQEMVDQAKQLPVFVRAPILDPDRELIHGLEVGDILPVRVDTGLTQLDGVNNYRVVAFTVPPTADRIDVDLVPVPA